MSHKKPLIRWWSAWTPLVIVMAVVACSRGAIREPWETADLAETPVEQVQLEDVAGLRVERIRFRSDAAGDLRFFIALIPKDDRRTGEALVLSHGWGDRPEDLILRLDVAQAYSDLLLRERVRPAVLVLPDVRFDAKYRRKREEYTTPQYLGLIAEEIRGIVSELYRVPLERDAWHAGGFSFGGYLSLDVGRRYDERFGSVSVVSAFGEDDWSYWPDPRIRAPRLLLACGTRDRFYARMVRLHERFVELEVDHTWLTADGGHDFKYWKSVLEPMLLFHLGTEAWD